MSRPDGELRAWVETKEGKTIAAFVGADEVRREPARRICQSVAEAQQWVAAEANALGLTVRWSNAT